MKFFIKKLLYNLFMILFSFLLFGGLYFLLESAWKGHWTDYRMFILSGVIGLLIGLINNFFTYETDILLQGIVGTLIALLCECILGYNWNVEQGLELWNYSSLPFSAVNDQINLFFAFIWLVLSITCVVVSDYVWWKLFKYKKDIPPYYKLFGRKIFQFRLRRR